VSCGTSRSGARRLAGGPHIFASTAAAACFALAGQLLPALAVAANAAAATARMAEGVEEECVA
jgi:hypothetical protein